jgi:CheY-like chemotaxis protein
LRSRPGRGSVFRFTVDAGDPARVVAGLNESASGAPAALGRHVLCIDDEPAILEGLSSLLGRWGCIVRGVLDEAQALRALDEGFLPDAVLCDYQLANHRTGAEALQAVRAALLRHGHTQTVTLLITGDMASSELEALAAQGIPVLHKPVTAARLRRTLEMLWQRAGQGAGHDAGAGGGAGGSEAAACDTLPHS